MTTFHMPDLGEGLQEAEIIEWHVSEGEVVVADQPLLSVETDKAVVEVPAPSTGRIVHIHAAIGDIVEVGAAIVDLETAAIADTGTIAGELPQMDEPREESPKSARQAIKSAAAVGAKAKASPAVRKLASTLGVDLSTVAATGPKGNITAADIHGMADVLSEANPNEPLRGARRAMARRMARSHAEAVPATTQDEADIGAWADGTDTTVRLVRAMAVAASVEPALNAWFMGVDKGRRLLESVDLGIAVDTKSGLIVPVLRDVGSRDAAGIRNGLDALKRDALANKVPPEALRGASLTLSNFGVCSLPWWYHRHRWPSWAPERLLRASLRSPENRRCAR